MSIMTNLSRLCFSHIPANIHDLKANTEDKLLNNSFWREKLVKHLTIITYVLVRMITGSQ